MKNVKKNLHIVASYMLTEYTSLVIPKQVHGNRVEEVSLNNFNNIFESDSLVSKDPNILLGVLTADCAPLLLADSNSGYVAAVHVGWKGAVKGIIEKTITKMYSLGVNRNNIIAAIGPTIGPESFEIGSEVLSLFSLTKTGSKNLYKKGRKDKLIFNLPGWIKEDLKRLSVQNIWNSNLDTMKDSKLFFSHRVAISKNSSQTGRMISVIQSPLS